MNTFFKRTLFGSVYVMLIIISLIISPYSFVLLFLVLQILALVEFYKMTAPGISKTSIILNVLISIVLFVISFLTFSNHISAGYFILLIPLFLSLFILELYKPNELSINNIGTSILGIIYIAVPLSLSNLLVYQTTMLNDYSYYILLGIFILIWANDSFAYITGMLLGKHKLFEKISPNKTWEGFFGGLIFTVLSGYILSRFFHSLQSLDWIIIALLVSVFGTFGDLTESMFKRRMNVKDSGKIMPGHGGILDRIDSLLFCIPIIVFYLLIK
ncbi:MAG: CDP-archaeol synthase [Bacteroidales bacterium]|nr:CDP-archaeol synthase [Bacteroidales bacterium]